MTHDDDLKAATRALHQPPAGEPDAQAPQIPAIGFSLPALVALSQFARSRRRTVYVQSQSASSPAGQQ